jgi:hypothetical protein
MKRFSIIAAIMAFTVFVVMSPAGGSDHGCKVLMCMSNPAGPTAVQECVPDINKLMADMAKPNFSFPKCEEAESGGSRAVPTNERHELCPDGYAELPSGVIALKNDDYKKATKPAGWITHDETKYLKWSYPIYVSAAEGSGGYSGGRGGDAFIVCGKGGSNNIKIAKEKETSDGVVTYKTYENSIVYSEIAFAKVFSKASMVVDIYIDGKLYMRVPLNL